jgi:dihydroorotate dehydrogenase (fumarate)
MAYEVDLSVEISGIKFKNPLVLSEGPLTGNSRLIERAAKHNIGAIVTKSIRQEAAQSSNPYMIAANRGLINADWTDIGFDAWLKELDKLDISTPLITNVATNHVPPKKAAELAEVLQLHGAAMVTFSDYEPENLVDAVKYARKEVNVPIMVKLPPFVKNIGDLCKAQSERCGVVHLT